LDRRLNDEELRPADYSLQPKRKSIELNSFGAKLSPLDDAHYDQDKTSSLLGSVNTTEQDQMKREEELRAAR
jgi:hypothetical protein